MNKDDEQNLFIKMKTREKPITISEARDMSRKHDFLIFASIVMICLTSVCLQKREDLFLHWATVADLLYGVFVTAITVIDESQVLQYIVVNFSKEVNYQHLSTTDSLGKDLVGWLYQNILLKYCYLTKEDCPVGLSEEQISICLSHYQCGAHHTTQLWNVMMLEKHKSLLSVQLVSSCTINNSTTTNQNGDWTKHEDVRACFALWLESLF
jgi:hypothetical protein